MLTIEFFHDAVCGWCYNQSPRLRQLASRYQLDIVHRAFVLQRNEQEMIARFGSLELAKIEILGHWQQCKQHADEPDRINIEGMAATSFNYPSGYQAALAAKAVESIQGQQGHWDYFDAVQYAHLYLNLNIADPEVLVEIAREQGTNPDLFFNRFRAGFIKARVDADNQRARQLGVSTIPAMHIDNAYLICQSLNYQQLVDITKHMTRQPA
ncbi:DsbA family oxidoreductase [Neptunicella marina]|uniref:DsbA family protein n=1 Tax=Neptunicella marina TaxID=2125989 RepID=A0A8J6IXZ3_9ALTE|nr:DsbA family protein [Neptunicella marina]MBC3767298.1 DsbA family protein [Neptunicella marina]